MAKFPCREWNSRKFARYSSRSVPFGRRLRFELLENRRLLSADLVSKAAFPSLSAGGSLGAVSADGRYVAFTSDAESLRGIDIVPGIKNVYRFDRTTGDVALVSVNTAGTGGGNLDSLDPVISADGSVVAFYSSASNLHPLDKDTGPDVFARNLTTGTTYLVSVNSAGTGSADGGADSPVISADGTVVAFRSTASNLHPLDASFNSDVFARNLVTGTTYLVSVRVGGSSIGDSDSPVISADGSVVAFSSTSPSLHPLDKSMTSDVFARNLLTGTTQLVSINSAGTAGGNGASDTPVISANGSVVAFRSSASNLHPLDTNTTSDIFARNLTTGTTYLVSVNSAGTGSGDGTSDEAVISANGDVVAFRSSANNLDPLDTNPNSDVFARSLAMSAAHLVSVHSSGPGSGTANSNNYSSSPAISADGNVVAFYSSSTDLESLDTNTSFDAFARNLATGTTSLVSVNSAGTGGGVNFSFGGQTFPVISADGGVVAFESLANDLTIDDFNARADVYVRQLSSATVELASRVDLDAPSTTAGDNSEVNKGALSADGRYLAFVSSAANLVNGLEISAGVQNVYRLDRNTGHIDLVSVNISGAGSGNKSSDDPTISADGNVVAFSSNSSNLTPLATGSSNIFARNLATGETYLVSINTAGTGGGNTSSSGPVISADGNVVAFYSYSNNLHPLATDGDSNIYARNLALGTTDLVSVSADGTSGGNNLSSSPVISADGSVVAFRSEATNLHPAKTTSTNYDIFARNLVTGITYLVTINSTGNGSGSGVADDTVISANGAVVAFRSSSTNLHPLKHAVGHYDIFARNLLTGTTYLVSMSSDGTSGGTGDSDNPVISADGNIVAFQSSATNLHPLDTDFTSDVFARNLSTGTTYLVSASSDGAETVGHSSYEPAISADGSVVAFFSFANTLAPLKATNNYFDVFARNVATGVTYLMSANSAGTGAGNNNSQDVVISADGRVVAFDSDARNLVGRDYNSSSDVFIGTIPSPPVLVGDYDRSSAVDASDYVLWRKTSGATGLAPYSGADGSGSGSVGAEDYAVWRSHFGQSLPPSGTSLSEAAVTIAEGTSSAAGAELASAAPSVGQRAATFYSFQESAPSGRRPAGSRHASRPTITTDTRREDALLAWLGARANRQNSGDGEASGHDRSECAFDEQSVDNALDELFERVAPVV
jgi:hypothetical protein